MKKLAVIVLIVGMVMGFGNLSKAKNVSLGLKVGTLGIGPEICYHINDAFSVRGQFGYFSKNFDTTEADVKYDLKFKIRNAGLLLDWHPFEGAFRISAGLFYNGNKFTGDAKSIEGEKYTINGHTYYLNKISASIKYTKLAPYIGIGYDTASSKDSGLGFLVDLGVFYSKPKVSVDAYGDPDVINDPQFKADLSKTKSELKSYADKLKFYPVIMIGLTYRF
ncbi:hypothetical protein [Hippea alviniae]|uniref:hypothetical protein n=1 Tax=Hippea alviniae TaxID=1279027 RepID=UPI0003B4FD97|nr:hypothetical protein [Hippea alviniae]